jgi:hypothetical protein
MERLSKLAVGVDACIEAVIAVHRTSLGVQQLRRWQR